MTRVQFKTVRTPVQPMKGNKLEVAKLGNPVLRMNARNIRNPFSQNNRQLIFDMIETLKEKGGVGLAAPQVYRSSRLLLCQTFDEQNPESLEEVFEAYFNPKIKEKSLEMEKGFEGCLSIPSLYGLVPRHKEIEVEYTNLDGDKVQQVLTDLNARVFQHELDHLDGITFLDRLETNTDLAFESEAEALLQTQDKILEKARNL
eukprot:gb/GECH01000749.1/.p1 GENE.gb/GECH01000749.1/~~gb/GECH01000749.1/.p1  ORF type:complete len:202 (+),score=48.93 gb/GECH01000749.1/:1-606(+)